MDGLTFPNKKISGISYIFTFLLLITFVLGHYLFSIKVMGITLYGYRILVMVMVIFGVGTRLNSPVEKSYLALCISWFAFGMLSLLWTYDAMKGFREMANLGFGVLFTFVLLGLIDTKTISFRKIFQMFARAWLVAVFITLLFLAYELISGQALEYSRAYTSFGMEESSHLYTAGFSGPSVYGPFLVVGISFFLFMIFNVKNVTERALYGVGIFTSAGAIIMTGSRLSAIAMIAIFVLYSIFRIRKKFFFLFSIMFIAGVGMYFAYGLNPRAFEKHFEDTTQELKQDNKVTSFKLRYRALVNGLYITTATSGIGCGAGNFVDFLQNNSDIPYPQQKKVGSHSVLVSIISEYGIVIFLLFMLWFFYVTSSLIKMRKYFNAIKYNYEAFACESLIISQVAFIIWSFAFGGGLGAYIIWLYLASLTILTSSLWILCKSLKKHEKLLVLQNNSQYN